MKKIIILGLAAVGVSVSTVNVSADSQYPASDFQPKVVYIDKDAAVTVASSSVDSKCPGQKSEAKQTEFDPKYPAASFQPKTIYP